MKKLTQDAVGQHEIQIFNNQQFGQLRATTIDGEPWLVGKDVAAALGYSDTAQAIRVHVDTEDKGVVEMTTPGGKQPTTVINESGLYSLVLSSKLPAAKKFRRWVTSEVLPSIRKTGGYIPSNGLSDAEIMARALLIAQNTIQEKDKAIARQTAKIEEDRPKVAFADMVANSSKTMSIGDFAQTLRDEGNPVFGRNQLFEWMRNRKILKQNNHPYQKYINQRLFEVITVEKYGNFVQQTRLTGKGQLFLHRELEKYLSNYN